MKLLKDNVFVTYPHSLTTGQGGATVDTVLETPGFREIKRIYWEKYFQASKFGGKDSSFCVHISRTCSDQKVFS